MEPHRASDFTPVGPGPSGRASSTGTAADALAPVSIPGRAKTHRSRRVAYPEPDHVPSVSSSETIPGATDPPALSQSVHPPFHTTGVTQQSSPLAIHTTAGSDDGVDRQNQSTSGNPLRSRVQRFTDYLSQARTSLPSRYAELKTSIRWNWREYLETFVWWFLLCAGVTLFGLVTTKDGIIGCLGANVANVLLGVTTMLDNDAKAGILLAKLSQPNKRVHWKSRYFEFRFFTRSLKAMDATKVSLRKIRSDNFFLKFWKIMQNKRYLELMDNIIGVAGEDRRILQEAQWWVFPTPADEAALGFSASSSQPKGPIRHHLRNGNLFRVEDTPDLQEGIRYLFWFPEDVIDPRNDFTCPDPDSLERALLALDSFSEGHIRTAVEEFEARNVRPPF